MNMKNFLKEIAKQAKDAVKKARKVEKLSKSWKQIAAATAGIGGAAAIAVVGVSGGKEDEKIDISGRWQIAYYDTELGIVKGRAFVSKEQNSAEVTLIHPESNKEYVLKTTDFSFNKKKVKMELTGNWPGANNAPFPLGENIETPASGRSFSVKLGKEEETFEAKQGEEAEENTVHIELDVTQNAMGGEWYFKANPQTGREKDGDGRLGDFNFTEDGGAEQRGRENWWRPKPRILLTVALDDQSDKDAYTHPDGYGRNYRELIVLGLDLPIPDKENIALTSKDKNIEYKNRILNEMEVDKAFTRLESQVDEKTYTRIREKYDAKEISALKIEAKLSREVLPGLTHYTINGADGNWLLKFADYMVDLSFVRKVSERPDDYLEYDKVEEREGFMMEFDDGEKVFIPPRDIKKPKPTALYEPAWMSYYPEEVYVQIATIRELPFDKIPLIISVDGKRSKFVGIADKKTGKDPISKEKPKYEDIVWAYKSSDNPKQYLSRPIALVGPKHPVEATYSDHAIFSQQPIHKKSRISALVHHDHEHFSKRVWQFQEITKMASTRVYSRPSTRGLSKRRYNLTWKSAIEEAATCYVDFELKDHELDAVKIVDDYTHYIINAWAVENVDFERKTNILLGDHAAMILLVDTFSDMIVNHMQQMEQALKNPRGLYNMLRPFGAGGASDAKTPPPIMKMQVTAPSGNKIKLIEIFGPEDYIKDKFGVSGKAAKKWQDKAIKEAVKVYLPRVEDAYDNAWLTSPCDTQELLNVVGKGFHNVVGQAFPRLIRKSAHTGLWEPDRAARAWAMSLNILAESVKLEDQLSSQDTSALLMQGALLFAVPAALNLAAGGAAWAIGVAAPELFVSTALTSAAMAAIDVAEFGYATYISYNKHKDLQAELDFAEKSAAIIGYERYTKAKDEEHSVYRDITIDMLFAGGGLLMGADDILKTAKGISKPTEAMAEGARRVAQARQHNKLVRQEAAEIMGENFKRFKDYTHETILKEGKKAFLRLSAESSHLWDETVRTLKGPPKTSPEVINKILAEVYDELEKYRKIYDAVQNDPQYIKKLYENGKITKKQYQGLTSRLAEGERLFPDPSKLSVKDLELLAGRIADEVFEEGAQYGLKKNVLIDRAKRRIKSALTNKAVLEQSTPVLSGAEMAKLTAEQQQALSKMYDELLQLPAAERAALLEKLADIYKRGKLVGVESLTRRMQIAYHLANDIILEASLKPRWAKALTVDQYNRIKDLARRKDFHKMLENETEALKALISDDFALKILKGEPFENIAQAKKAIEKAKKRIKDPVEGVFESANPKHGNPKGFEIIKDQYFSSAPGKAQLKVMRGGKPVGGFNRSLEHIGDLRRKAEEKLVKWLGGIPNDAKMLIMNSARLEAGIPSMLKNLDTPMIKGKGTPLGTFMNLRALHELGIGFADTSLQICKLSFVLNKKTAMQLDWLKRVYPNKSLNELIQHTHSYQYAESALKQAGYEIEKAFLQETKITEAVSEAPWGGAASFGKEGDVAFKRRYGFNNPDQEFTTGHDIYLKLKPTS